MNPKILAGICFLISVWGGLFAQSSSCNSAEPFCTGTTYNFPMSTSTVAETGPDYACLYTQPNPVWYFMLVSSPGDIIIGISSPEGNDVDFIAWGPFTSPTGACTAGLTSNCTSCPNNTDDPTFYPSGNTVDCSYDAASSEVCHITNAIVGQYYMLCITNYEDVPGTLNFSQIGGTGATNCNIVYCSMTGLTAIPGVCDPAGNTFSLTGQITFENPPTTGQLIVTDNSGITQTYNAPFTSPFSYTLNGIFSDGTVHTVNAYFSDAPTCSMQQTYTAPPSCIQSCIANAGPDQSLCALTTTLAAVTLPGDHDLSWTSTNPAISFSDATLPNAIVTASAPGAYTLVWHVTSDDNISCTDDMIVTFNEIPTVGINASGTTLCQGKPLTLSGTGASTYTWTGNVTNSVAFYPQNSQTYTVTGTNPSNCSNTASIDITVIPAPQVVITTSPEHCDKMDGSATTTVSNGLPPYNFLWNTIPSQSGTSISGVHAGNYTLVVSDANQCETSTDFQIGLIPGPTASFYASPGFVTTTDNPTFLFYDQSAGGVILWQWDFGDGSGSSEPSPEHSYSVPGSYNVTLTVTDPQGCTNFITHIATVKEIHTIYVPSAFSPNGDGLNEVFMPKARNIDIDQFEMRIFDRWGKVLFITKDINCSWNGKNDEEVLKPGVYSYFIKYTDNEGIKHELRGFIYLSL